MYFDETNNYFDDYKEVNNNVEINFDNINFNRSNKLFSTEEGFNKGNLFQNLYSKYKNHVYKLNVNNKKDELLYKIQMYTFAQKDLTLYLDTNPTDQSMLEEFNKTNNKLKELKTKYESDYGPLCITEVNSNEWTWNNNPWPWDKGGK